MVTITIIITSLLQTEGYTRARVTPAHALVLCYLVKTPCSFKTSVFGPCFRTLASKFVSCFFNLFHTEFMNREHFLKCLSLTSLSPNSNLKCILMLKTTTTTTTTTKAPEKKKSKPITWNVHDLARKYYTDRHCHDSSSTYIFYRGGLHAHAHCRED